MHEEGETGYCSPRCLQWDFFGVPALKQDEFLREMRRNQSRETVQTDWKPPKGYPALGDTFEKEATEALAVIKSICEEIRANE